MKDRTCDICHKLLDDSKELLKIEGGRACMPCIIEWNGNKDKEIAKQRDEIRELANQLMDRQRLSERYLKIIEEMTKNGG
jgi:hypothetical protein